MSGRVSLTVSLVLGYDCETVDGSIRHPPAPRNYQSLPKTITTRCSGSTSAPIKGLPCGIPTTPFRQSLNPLKTTCCFHILRNGVSNKGIAQYPQSRGEP